MSKEASARIKINDLLKESDCEQKIKDRINKIWERNS